MSDNYQAVYDAIRSRFSYCDVNSIVREACQIDASFAIEQVKQEFCNIAYEQLRPAVIHRPLLEQRSGVWVAYYGDCEGKADSPDAAMRAFDTAWHEKVIS